MDIANIFGWLGSQRPMEPDLAEATQRASAKDFVSASDWIVKKMPPRKALDAIREWTRALNALPEPAGGKASKAGMTCQAGADPWAAWIQQWAHARFVGCAYGEIDGGISSPEHSLAAWEATGHQALDALDDLWRAWGFEPLARAGRLRLGVDESLAQAFLRRGGKRDVQSEVGIWLSLGAVPSKGFSLALSDLTGQPAAWRAAAALAACGGRVGADEESKKTLRQWISCSLSDGVSDARSLGAQVRVNACLHLLEAGGWTLDSYRSKAGGRFEEMALGAVWSWTGAALAVALSQVNLTWSRTARAKAPEHAARMLSKSLMSAESILATLTAIEAGDGLGPWSPGMQQLANKAKDWRDKRFWLEPFGRWAVLGKWGADDLAAAEKNWPDLLKSPAWGAARDACALAEALGAVPKPFESKARVRPRPAL